MNSRALIVVLVLTGASPLRALTASDLLDLERTLFARNEARLQEPSNSIPQLIEQLSDDDIEVRERAQTELERIGGPAVPALENATRGEDVERASRARVVLDRLNRLKKRETEFDKDGKPIKTTDYNVLGNRRREVVYSRGDSTVTEFDWRGRPVRRTEYSADGTKVTEYVDGNPVRTTEFDRAGRPRQPRPPPPPRVAAATSTGQSSSTAQGTSGVRTTTIATPHGKIRVYSTAASGTFSGRVEREPEGRTEEERNRNAVALGEYRVQGQISGRVVTEERTARKGTGEFLKWTIPAALLLAADGGAARPGARTGRAQITVQDPRGNPVGGSEIDVGMADGAEPVPVRPEPPPQPLRPGEARDTRPQNIQLPRLGQAEAPSVAVGDFDGDVGNTGYAVGDRDGDILIETAASGTSPGALVVRNPSNITGLTEVEVTERDLVKRGRFNVLHVTAQGKTTLRPFERTNIVWTVSGFRELEPEYFPVPYEEVNRDPETITADEVRGTVITHAIQHSEVRGDIYTRVTPYTATSFGGDDWTVAVTVAAPRFIGCGCKDITVGALKQPTVTYGKFSDWITAAVPFQHDTGGGMPAGDGRRGQAAAKITFTLPGARVTTNNPPPANAVTATRSCAISRFMSSGRFIAWRKPADPKHPTPWWGLGETGPPLTGGSAVCPNPINLAAQTVEFVALLAASGDKYTLDYVIKADGCEKKVSYEITLEQDARTKRWKATAAEK